MISTLCMLIILIFVFYCITKHHSCNCPQGCTCGNCSRCKSQCPCDAKENFEDIREMNIDDSSVSKKFVSQDPFDKRANTTGLKTQSAEVNLALGTTKDNTFNERYAKLIEGEVGVDVIDSHKRYAKQVPTDSKIRFLDTEIETDYVQWQGLSLNRRKSPQVNASNSTQIQGITTEDYAKSSGSIRDYLSK